MKDQESNELNEPNPPLDANQQSDLPDKQDSTIAAVESERPAGALTSQQTEDTPDATALEGHIWQGRTDWRNYAGICILCVAAILLSCTIVIYTASHTSLTGGWAFLICVMIAALVSMGVGFWILLRIIRTRYRLTDQRLFIERGVFSQTIDQIELIRVDDVRIRKKFIDRLLGLGSVELLTTDTSDSHLVIEGIRNPEEIAEHVRSRMKELRSRSLFIENL